MFLWGYLHVILASLLTGSLVMLSISAWQLRKKAGLDAEPFVRTAKVAITLMVPVSMAVLVVGSHLGVIETTYQPMKVAAMEAQWNNCGPCSFSAAQVGGWTSSDETPTKILQVPHLLSLLATGSWNGQVVGLNSLQKQYEKQYGRNVNYVPNLFIQYWSMRVMAYLGSVIPILGLWGLWLWRKKRLATTRSFLWVATWAGLAPFAMNTAGWMLTENGRQPWVVQGLLLTRNGNSPSVSLTEVALTLVSFWVMYLALGVVWGYLMLRYARRTLEPDTPAELPDGPNSSAPRAPALTY